MSEKSPRSSQYPSRPSNTPPSSPNAAPTRGEIAFTKRVFAAQVRDICAAVGRNAAHPEDSIEDEQDSPQSFFNHAYDCMVNRDVSGLETELNAAFFVLQMIGLWAMLKQLCQRGRQSAAKDYASTYLRMALFDVGMPTGATDRVMEVVNYYIERTCSSMS